MSNTTFDTLDGATTAAAAGVTASVLVLILILVTFSIAGIVVGIMGAVRGLRAPADSPFQTWGIVACVMLFFMPFLAWIPGMVVLLNVKPDGSLKKN